MSLPAFDGISGDPEIGQRLARLLETAHRIWSSPDERRRMRAFGWRPAVEEGVLKREWHGMNVRVSDEELRAEIPDRATVGWDAVRHAIVVDGEEGLPPTPPVLEVVSALVGLIGAYERWVEAREGRRERIDRAKTDGAADRRTVNALAETRRLQRMLHTSGRSRTRG